MVLNELKACQQTETKVQKKTKKTLPNLFLGWKTVSEKDALKNLMEIYTITEGTGPNDGTYFLIKIDCLNSLVMEQQLHLKVEKIVLPY